MRNEPTLRIMSFHPLMFQCSVCGTRYHAEEGNFTSTKLLTLVFAKHVTERHPGLLSKDFCHMATRFIQESINTPSVD